MQPTTFTAPPPERVREILWRIPRYRIAVAGDFFLDKYLVTDPALSEVSIETGLEARQVVEVRCSPGAAGTVSNNLAALGVKHLEAIGVIGDDGEGYELLRGLERTGVDVTGLARATDRFTPTYTKPMVRKPCGDHELERLDIKNRSRLLIDDEKLLAAQIGNAVKRCHAVIIADQVQERNCGAITDSIRDKLGDLARANPDVYVVVDSRARIGEFRNVALKPNLTEAARALAVSPESVTDLDRAAEIGAEMARRSRRTVYLTMGERGILVCGEDMATHVPALRVAGPIDIVGAGDSATAGIVCALCAGASPEEAAYIGGLCAAVTIRKLGTTGTATPEEILGLVEFGH